MLINLLGAAMKHCITIRGVVHCGAHFGEEHGTYKTLGSQKMVYIEPCAAAFSVLRERFKDDPSVTLFRCAVGEEQGLGEMHIETRNQGQSNSLLKPALHTQYYKDVVFHDKEVVQINTLDNLPFDRSQFNMLVMDCQGYEGHILRGGKETLKGFDYVYSEVNTQELYEGCTKQDELNELLSDFEIAEMVMTGKGWGDSLYVRK